MRKYFFLLWISVWLLSFKFCHAHWADLSVAEINVKEREVVITLTIPAGLLSSVRPTRVEKISQKEIQLYQTLFQKFFGERIKLSDEKEDARLTSVQLSTFSLPNLTPSTSPHTGVTLFYHFAHPIHRLKIDYQLFLPNISTASCLATLLQSQKVQTLVFTPSHHQFQMQLGSAWYEVRSFILLGIKHILTGYDHILFLVSLLIVAPSMGYLMKVVTAFTIAHSVTLTLAVLNIVSLPSRWVEPAIALTIVYVAAENFWRKSLKGRWMVTFGFGLIHGLGFASVLKEFIPPSRIALSLASFNLGVELGQIFIVIVIYTGVRLLQKWTWEPFIRQAVSALVMAVAGFWFIQRIFFEF